LGGLCSKLQLSVTAIEEEAVHASDFTKTLFLVVAGLFGAEKESLLSLFSSFNEGDLGFSVTKLSVPVCRQKNNNTLTKAIMHKG